MTEIQPDHSVVSVTGQEHISVQTGLQSLASAMHAHEADETIESVREMNAILWQQNDLLKRQLGKSRKAAYWQFASFFGVIGVMAWALAIATGH